MKPFFNFAETEDFLYKLRNSGSKFSLDRIKKMCGAFGNPQRKYPVVHVAGTNGKGSVCAMLEAVLRGVCGIKTGMYTSPHLLYLGERIQIDRKPTSKEALMSDMFQIRKMCGKLFEENGEYPSFFEFMTCAAFLEFERNEVDVGIVEVGLGGRLDSTNVVSPEVCAITSIGLDHTEFLGNTLEEIAFEKAGIIKNGVPVVLGKLPCEAERVILKIAGGRGARVLKAEDMKTLPQTSLEGNFQRINAGVAFLAAKTLSERGGIFSPLKGEEGDKKILEALKNVSWSARWERINLSKGKTLILDASHNPEGAKALEENLVRFLSSNGNSKPVVSVGVLGESRAEAILKVVSKYASKIILLEPKEPRALSFEKLREKIPPSFPREKILNRRVDEVYVKPFDCREIGPGETIISTGSIYLAGEVLSALGAGVSDGLSDKLQ